MTGSLGRRTRDSSGTVQELLEPLGPLGLKLGCYLALRPDEVGRRTQLELLRLSEITDPISADRVAAILREDLAADPDRRFAAINPRPLWSGSLAQLHEGRTQDGEEVAIKVLRPGARRELDELLSRRRELTRVYNELGVRVEEMGDSLTGFRAAVLEELDFDLERRTRAHSSRSGASAPRARVPHILPELCGPRVLTTELLPGLPLTELFPLLEADRTERLAALGVDPHAVAANLLLAVLEQSLERGRFHLDLHPSGLVVLADNRLGILGSARTSTLDPTTRLAFTQALLAVESDDVERAFDCLSDLLAGGEEADVSALRAEFLDRSRRRPSGRGDDPGEEAGAGRVLLALLRAARQTGYRVPSALASLCRLVPTAERIGALLGTSEALTTGGYRLLRRLRLATALGSLHPDVVQPAMLDLINLARDGPRLLRRMLTDVVEGRLVLRVRSVESEEDRRQGNARARLVSAALLSVGLAFLVGASRDAILFDRLPLEWLIWPLLGASWLWTLILWRNLR